MAQNQALLSIAGVLESMRTSIVTGQWVTYDRQEVMLACMQATIQILCGGSPSNIVLPTTAAAGLNDAVVARYCSGTIASTPYAPGGGNLATQTLVAADGGTTAITFATAFPNSATQVLYGLRNYSGAAYDTLFAYVANGTLSKTGFSIVVGGGAPGSTVSVDYLPFGT